MFFVFHACQVLDALVQAGANDNVTTNSQSRDGSTVRSTALILACVRGHEAVVRYLLGRGHNPNYAEAGVNPPILYVSLREEIKRRIN